MNKKHMAWTVGAVLVFVAAFGAYWDLQSPVSAGLYPGRVGGVYFTDATTYKLPVVWVRQFPWERDAPRPVEVSLLDDNGEIRSRSNAAGLQDLEWPVERPLWLRPRAVSGVLSLPFPKTGFTATAVTLTWEDGRTETYNIGRIRLENAALPPTAPTSMNQWARWEFEPHELVGNYLDAVPSGTLVDVISAMPGMEGTPPGLLYKEGHEYFGEVQAPYKDSGQYKPLTLPMEIKGDITIYLPFTEEAKARLRDTHYSTRHALVYRTGAGDLVTVPVGGYQHGRADDRTWRSWVPFFVYEARKQ